MRPYYIIALVVLVACTKHPDLVVNSSIVLSARDALPTRAGDPDDLRITDYNLYIFNAFGILEERVYVPARSLRLVNGQAVYNTRLLRDVPYTILAAANLGYELPFRDLAEAREYRFHLAYPDEYSQGIPMVAFTLTATVGQDGTLEVPLERLMARVELRIDRRKLNPDVRFKVTDVRVGACPSSALLIGPSKVVNREQCFSLGFGKAGGQVDNLNLDQEAGLSKSIMLYLLENCQGDLPDNGAYREVCSYIEMKAEYESTSRKTAAGERLIYRFYLGEGAQNYDVCRNTWYKATVCPEGDGLSEDSWRCTFSGSGSNTESEGRRQP